MTGTPPRGTELAIDPGAAVASPVLVKHALDAGAQLPVLGGPATHRPAAPRVVARPRDAGKRAEPGDRVLVAVCRDERKPGGLGTAQNRRAFFKRACSSCKRWYARSRACRRRISRIGGTFTRGFRDPRNTPSRTCLRHFDNMNGWMSRAAATAWTSTPGSRVNRTAASLNCRLYSRTFRGPARGMTPPTGC